MVKRVVRAQGLFPVLGQEVLERDRNTLVVAGIAGGDAAPGGAVPAGGDAFERAFKCAVRVERKRDAFVNEQLAGQRAAEERHQIIDLGHQVRRMHDHPARHQAGCPFADDPARHLVGDDQLPVH